MSIRQVFLAIFGLLLALLAGVFVLMALIVGNQRHVADAELRRYESYKLADELRQSSDDLTRMARTYAVTGDPAYEQYFLRILAIRNGEAPRPQDYGGIYWDFVTATGEPPRPDDETVALHELMRRMAFTDAEMAKLSEAQDNSDALVAIEEQAMAAVKGLFADAGGEYVVTGEPDRELARQLLHGEAYHRAKASIMEPIEEFFGLVEARTAAETENLRARGRRLGLAAIFLMSVAVGMLILAYALIRMRVITPVYRLARAAKRVEAGDYSRKLPQESRDELGRLARAFNEMSLAIERDIDERTRSASALADAREAAEAANRAKSTFLANMSHELRTPMNAIIGYSEMLAEDAADGGDDAAIADLNKINAAGKHLLALINDILDLSKIEAGRVELLPETFDLPRLVKDSAATVQPLNEKNGNRLVLDIAADVGELHADSTKLRQALLNLLSNAAKFTRHGTITLTVRRHADRVELAVADTGIGIPVDKLGTVFEEFTQADATTTRDFGGTGLGLAISRKFCRMMGGDITLVSTPGEGSTFTITLPSGVEAARPEDRRDATQGSSVAPRETGSAASVVLVIDDDPEARDLLTRTLERDGHRVVSAPGGKEGLAIARELRPAVITLDIMMPEMDGWAVLRQLKADKELRKIPVIFVSIIGEGRDEAEQGAAAHLTKPVDRASLLEAVRTHGGAADAAKLVEIADGDDPKADALLNEVRDALDP